MNNAYNKDYLHNQIITKFLHILSQRKKPLASESCKCFYALSPTWRLARRFQPPSAPLTTPRSPRHAALHRATHTRFDPSGFHHGDFHYFAIGIAGMSRLTLTDRSCVLPRQTSMVHWYNLLSHHRRGAYRPHRFGKGTIGLACRFEATSVRGHAVVNTYTAVLLWLNNLKDRTAVSFESQHD